LSVLVGSRERPKHRLTALALGKMRYPPLRFVRFQAALVDAGEE
jgi:hypothetical protein